MVATLLLAPGAAPAVAAEDISTSVTLNVACTKDGFQGEATLTATLSRADTNANWKTTIDRYRITPPGGSSDRSKANLQALTSIDVPELDRGVKRSLFNSADSMKQDGKWHDLGISGTIDNAPLIHRVDSRDYEMASYAEVTFVFDTPGDDPRCVARTPQSLYGSSIKDVTETENVPVRTQPFGYCLAVTPGGFCRIDKTDTKTSTITVDAGLSYGWVSAKLSHSWSHSRTITVAQTSPALNAGDRFYAYPTGTRYDFSTYAHFWGTQARVTPGSAYELDGGVAHEVIPSSQTPGPLAPVPAPEETDPTPSPAPEVIDPTPSPGPEETDPTPSPVPEEVDQELAP